ncbi:MAG: peptidylprolyl isomerase [Gemmatimonadaceae bacterium]|nr:peptidylprolyl isomerase [Gemmatimonadaceae bacterium]
MTTFFARLSIGAAHSAAPLSLRALTLAATLVALPAAAQTTPPTPPKAPVKDSAKAPVKDSSKGPPTTAGIPVDGIAAVVGDQVVLVSEVTAEAIRRMSQGYPVRTKEDKIKLETEVRDQLLEAELLVQKAKEDKIEVNEADLTRTVDDQERKVKAQFKTELEFRQALKENGFGTYDEWRKMQTDLMRRDGLQRDYIQKARRDGKMTAINVSEAEVTEAYEANKARLPRKEARVGLRQIVIATKPSDESRKKTRAKIDSLRAELEKRPDDFENMAKKESMDPGSKELGGDLGWNRRGRMVPEFDRMMFALNPGAISPVVETSFGYHIIRVDRVQPAEVKARHILLSWTLDSADEVRAKAQADSIAKAWRAGASFDSLSVRFHDVAGGEEKTIPEYTRDSLPEVYRNAIEGKALNTILDPFPIPSGQAGINKYVIAQITFLDEAGEYTLSEMRERIRSQLSEERSMRRLIDTLKKQTYISVRYDPAKAAAAIVP